MLHLFNQSSKLRHPCVHRVQSVIAAYMRLLSIGTKIRNLLLAVAFTMSTTQIKHRLDWCLIPPSACKAGGDTLPRCKQMFAGIDVLLQRIILLWSQCTS